MDFMDMKPSLEMPGRDINWSNYRPMVLPEKALTIFLPSVLYQPPILKPTNLPISTKLFHLGKHSVNMMFNAYQVAIALSMLGLASAVPVAENAVEGAYESAPLMARAM